MKIITQILIIITILLPGCANEIKLDENKLEREVISQTIFELAPEYPDLLPIEYSYTESKELQKIRFDSVLVHRKSQIDSLGIEIWLNDELDIPDELFLNELSKYPEFESNSAQSLKKKKINFHNFESKNKIILKSKMEDLPINNLGFVKYSRIFFNE